MEQAISTSRVSNRAKVCVVCLHRSKRQLRSGDAGQIRKLMLQNVDPSMEMHPSGICGSCSSTLDGYQKDDISRSIRVSPELFAPKPYYTGRGPCFCMICEASRGNLPKVEDEESEQVPAPP